MAAVPDSVAGDGAISGKAAISPAITRGGHIWDQILGGLFCLASFGIIFGMKSEKKQRKKELFFDQPKEAFSRIPSRNQRLDPESHGLGPSQEIDGHSHLMKNNLIYTFLVWKTQNS